MEAGDGQPISEGQFSEAITRLHESAIRAAVEQIDYFEAIGDIDESAALMLRQGVAAAIRLEAMHYAGDASFTRRPNPKDGEARELIESLRRDHADERRDHQREIARAILSA